MHFTRRPLLPPFGLLVLGVRVLILAAGATTMQPAAHSDAVPPEPRPGSATSPVRRREPVPRRRAATIMGDFWRVERDLETHRGRLRALAQQPQKLALPAYQRLAQRHMDRLHTLDQQRWALWREAQEWRD